MGGVPVLLMIAAMSMGITYGWQPDESGQGVEYLVQVSPDELAQLERIGEISSSIDPAVRGRVTRILVRVGSGPLPRIAPPRSMDSSAFPVASADAMPVPVPEFPNSSQTAVLKPDPQGGFSFPSSVPSSLTDAANTARSNVDKAGREIKSRAEEELSRAFGGTANTAQQPADPRSLDPRNAALIAPPATRTLSTDAASSFAPPPFTGPPAFGQGTSSQNYANTYGTDSRDNNWGNLTEAQRAAQQAAAQQSAAQQASVRGTGLSTDPAGPNLLGADPRSTGSAASSQLGANGLRTTDAFARPPAGLTAPRSTANTYGQTSNGSAASTRSSSTSLNDQYLAEQQRLREQQQAQADRQAWLDQQQGAASTQGTGTAGYDPVYGYARNQATYTKATTTAPDSRLTDAQLNAGAWSVDDQDRVYDQAAKWMPNERLAVDAGLASGSSSLRDPLRQSASSLDPRWDESNYGAADRATTDRFTQDRLAADRLAADRLATERFASERLAAERLAADRLAAERQAADARLRVAQTDPPSLSDRGINQAGLSGNVFESQPEIAAQPFFNSLLLISFVANVYLVFWLKNLRLQFRDMVAAKRMASSNAAT